MRVTTIQEAVEVLNREKWLGRDDWQFKVFALAPAAATPIGPHRRVGSAAADVLYEKDAIFIADSLELRRVIRPMIEHAATRDQHWANEPDDTSTWRPAKPIRKVTDAEWRELALWEES